MDTFTVEHLSGSTDGSPVIIAATASPGTTIHTNDGTGIDKTLLYAINTDSSDRTFTLELAGTGTSYQIPCPLKANGENGPVFLGAFVISNSKAIKGFTLSGANKVHVWGENWKKA